MNARFLLDTNICIYIRRRQPPKVLQRFRELAFGEAALSVVTLGELVYGVRKSPTPEAAWEIFQNFAGSFQILQLPIEAANTYGEIRAALESRGEIIGTNDLWIAAHAKTLDLTLVTNNVREFRRVRGLKIENWTE
jgi:tRNA(fMet)-specific endonuclease VapC